MTTEETPTRGLEAIVLAAGSGARFGGGKLTAPYMASVLLDGALAAALAAPVRSVTVVTGDDAENVAEAARTLFHRVGQTDSLRIVHADDHALGIAHSLRMGIASLPLDAAGAFIFLGDMPRVPRDVLDPLAQAVLAGAPAAAPTFAGQRGNPVLVSRSLFPDLLALTGDTGARAILDRLGDRLVLIEAADDGVLFDIDRAEDLRGRGAPPQGELSQSD